MNSSVPVLTCLAFISGAMTARSQEPSAVVYKPLSIGALWEFGKISSAKFTQVRDPIDDIWVDHFGAFLTQEATVNERLQLAIGLGGVFQFPKPELVNPVFGGSQNKAFFIGPTRATADYLFGEVEKPWLKLGLGLFPYKYNPDAANLGEYLFRTGTYPSWIMTGGYVVVNSTASYLQGFKAESQFGNLKLDFLATTETKLAPLYDWSFSLVGSYKVGKFLELGAGITLANYISVNPEKTTLPDSVQREQLVGARNNYNLIGLDTNAIYTYKAEKVMARIAFSPLAFLENDRIGPNDGKIYGELTVIGLKNYPYFYEKRSERTPIMIGFNVPTFKLLDRLSVEYESFNSPWINSTYNIGNFPSMPIPRIPDSTQTYYKGISGKDNTRWSVNATRTLTKGLAMHVQVAHDHLRLVSREFYYGPSLEPDELLMQPKNWYWMVQFSMGI